MRRLREVGCSSLRSYFDRVSADEDEKQLLFDLVSTNETHFFRDTQQFAFLEQNVIPRWRADSSRRIRVWSAGCSTGEEPFSIAMSLLWHLPADSIEIVATDLSNRALASAKAATWPAIRTSLVPDEYRKAFLLRGVGAQQGLVRASKELRSIIHFTRFNLHRDDYRRVGKFDLIFCRNVLIYFSQESKTRVVEQLLGCLTDNAFLLLGQAEALTGVTRAVVSIGPSIYQRNIAQASNQAANS
jgi:chemotaxis protein methyltransferase CheR